MYGRSYEFNKHPIVPPGTCVVVELEHHGHVYMENSKSIYSLPKAGLQAQDRLVMYLRTNDFIQCINTPSLFNHKPHDMTFTLEVEDFGIMFTRDEDLEHFLTTLHKQYEITEDRHTLQKDVSITIDHDRVANTITRSACPATSRKALVRFDMSTARRFRSPSCGLHHHALRRQQTFL
jgi:hypothetical protein